MKHCAVELGQSGPITPFQRSHLLMARTLISRGQNRFVFYQYITGRTRPLKFTAMLALHPTHPARYVTELLFDPRKQIRQVVDKDKTAQPSRTAWSKSCNPTCSLPSGRLTSFEIAKAVVTLQSMSLYIAPCRIRCSFFA